MGKKITKILSVIAVAVLVVGGLFVYEVNREHHYTPQTAEIQIKSQDRLDSAFMLRDGEDTVVDLSEHISFVSDVEKGTANLETTKKVFGFYECAINRVYDEYIPAVTYSVSDENIAAVDENGIVTAKSKGRVTITVTADQLTVEIPVTVYKIVNVTQLEQDIVLMKGDSVSLIRLGEYEIPRENFYSTNANVVKVDNDGTAVGISKGKAQVYTYKDETKTEKISTQLTVKQPVESVNLKNIKIYVGETATMKGECYPLNADYGTKLTYKSEQPAVATVSGNVVTGVKAGEAVVTVTSGNGVTAQAKVTVVANPPAKITITDISKDEFSAYDGEKYTDNSPYASYFKISFSQPVMSFRINTISHDGVNMTTGQAIYNYAQVPANTPVYFAICINHSDVLITRGFSYVDRDGTPKQYTLHQSLKDGSTLSKAY